MMEKESHETTSSSNGEERDTETWGTLEELLLASAVNRHGTTSWDSIANELQKRMKLSLFSPHNCKQKYVDLTRRFPSAAEERENADDVVVDQLRKLRVEQLKRQLHRHDVSIVSLELKVKRLEEEREKEPQGGSDLRIIEPNGINASGTGEKTGEPERSSAEKFDSAEDRSFNESNASEEERESKPEEKISADPVRKVEPVEESGSGNKASTSRPGELGESVSELKRESGKQQQSSDVQSSASLSKTKKKRRRFRSSGECDELEAEEVSPANKERSSVKSQPLIRFLEIIRSHKHGSVFQRRLPSQETEKYRSVIRQHMDLDTVQSKLDKGIYVNSHPKFYRDLLLIFTNAILFYRKSSAEHLAARELRKLVIHEIAQTTRIPDPEPVMKRPRSSTTSMVVCRRRSSGPTMQANLSAEPVKKSDHKVENNGAKKEKEKERENENENDNDNEKKVKRDRSSALRSNGNNSKKNITTATNRREKVGSESKQNQNNGNNNKGSSTSVLKKQGVANFLKRIKQNSPSSQEKAKNNGSAQGEEDDEAEEEEERERREKVVESFSASKKKRGNGNNIVKRNSNNNKDNVDNHVVVSRRNPTRRREREAAEARRADGRPPKRKAATISRTPESLGKGGRSSGRDGDEKSKKKSRR